jgi:hypothetical protein
MGLVRALRIACASVSCASALVAGLVGRSARAAYTVQRVATGLSNPVYVTHAPGDASRLFIVESLSGYDTAPLAERVARIKILNLTGPNAGTVNAAPFLEIPNVTPQREDQGLFGLAFHPDYTQNGMFYVNYTVGYDGGMSHVVRYQVDLSNPNAANPASATPVYSYFKPYYNHSADWMGFNPVATGDARNFLYLTTGDGGANTDPQNRAQDPTLPYGKVLRSPPTIPFRTSPAPANWSTTSASAIRGARASTARPEISTSATSAPVRTTSRPRKSKSTA